MRAYVAPSVEHYRRAPGRILRYMSRDVPELMEEFYELCERTQETSVTVVTARP